METRKIKRRAVPSRTHVPFTVSWNCRNLRMLSNTDRPHSTARTMEENLSSMITDRTGGTNKQNRGGRRK